MAEIPVIRSRQNPWFKKLRRLAQDPGHARRQGWIWLEGEHLCDAAKAGGAAVHMLVFSAAYPEHEQQKYLQATAPSLVLVLDEGLMHSISAMKSPAGVAFVMPRPDPPVIAPQQATVILDRVQDAGNVGSILRCAAAFGFDQVLALAGTALLWSPKVLRAGMGAHFSLKLLENLKVDDLQVLQLPRIVTSSHAGQYLHQGHLPWPCAWIFGNEGQGASRDLLQQADLKMRIMQPGGQESLNVAAAAAISLHASAVSRQVTQGG